MIVVLFSVNLHIYGFTDADLLFRFLEIDRHCYIHHHLKNKNRKIHTVPKAAPYTFCPLSRVSRHFISTSSPTLITVFVFSVMKMERRDTRKKQESTYLQRYNVTTRAASTPDAESANERRCTHF